MNGPLAKVASGVNLSATEFEDERSQELQGTQNGTHSCVVNSFISMRSLLGYLEPEAPVFLSTFPPKPSLFHPASYNRLVVNASPLDTSPLFLE